MNLEKIYQNNEATASLSISEEEGIIIVKLSGVLDHENYKLVFEKLFNIIMVYKYRKIIYNLKELKRTEMQSRAWYATVFLPKVIKHFGLDFKTALITSSNKYESISIDFLVKVGSNLGFKDNVCMFDTQESAIAWLEGSKEIGAAK
jgi:hypothetical protein